VARQGFFFFYFNDKVSREEHKPIYSGLRISGMPVSDQSDLPAFFSPRKVNLKIGLIPEDDLPRMVKSQTMTYRDWPNHGLQQAVISKEDLMKPAV
jgi:hypothetical protein